MARIFVRSPWIVEINEVGQTYSGIELFIWNDPDPVPTLPTYTLSKNVPSVSNVQTLYNISDYVREYIEHSTVQAIYATSASTPTTQWANVRIKRYSDGVLIGTDNHTAFNGFTQYEDGYNYDNGNTSIIDGATYYYYNSGVAPITNPLHYAGFFRTSGFSGNVWYTNLKTGASVNLGGFTSTPKDFPCVYDQYYADGNKIEIKNTLNTTVLKTFYFRPIEECKYDVVTCDFVNKAGSWQRTFFFKASYEGLEVETTKYNLMQSVLPDYSIYDGQFKEFNTNAKRTMRVNTGFVNDFYASILEQLMMSERVLLNGIPAFLRTKTLEKQKQINTKMINYTLEFEYAYNALNNVV